MKAQLAALASTAVTVAVIVGATHLVVTYAAALDGSMIVPGLLDIAFHHNRGVSFGLFAQDTQTGSRILVIALSLLIVALSIWAYRTSRPVIGVALGMVIGGALVNVLDRAIDGAVFDYLVVHLGPQPLFVCNAPDIAISLGFIILLADECFPALFDRKTQAEK